LPPRSEVLMGKRLTVVASLAVLALLLLLATTFAHEKRPQAPVVASLERPAVCATEPCSWAPSHPVVVTKAR